MKPTYYVYADRECDKVTFDLEEARRWEKELLDSEHADVFITDQSGRVIDESDVGS